jgi:hypothetical protein
MSEILDRAISSFRTNSEMFQTSFRGLDSAALNWKLNEGTWSIGQVIDHIIRINESYYPIFEQIRAGTYRVPMIARIGFIPNGIGNILVKSLEPTRKRKIKTFPIWEPAQSGVEADILNRFVAHHETLVEMLQRNESLFGKHIVVSSPANRYVVYPLDRVLDIMVVHEARHYNQALEIAAYQKGTQF